MCAFIQSYRPILDIMSAGILLFAIGTFAWAGYQLVLFWDDPETRRHVWKLTLRGLGGIGAAVLINLILANCTNG